MANKEWDVIHNPNTDRGSLLSRVVAATVTCGVSELLGEEKFVIKNNSTGEVRKVNAYDTNDLGEKIKSGNI